MFLVCPKCLAARPEPTRSVGFRCDDCRHAWEAPHPALARAYYATPDELALSLVSDDGERYRPGDLPATLGRDSDCRALQTNLSVSRRHCTIHFDPALPALVLTDLGGGGGTAVGTAMLADRATATVRHGSEVRLAGVRLRVELRLRTDPWAAAAGGDQRGTTPAAAAAAASADPALAAGAAIDLTACGPLAFVGLDRSGAIVAADRPEALATTLAAVAHGSEGGAWRLLVIRRAAVRVNGEVCVERDLLPSDQLQVAGRHLSFDRGRGRLEHTAGSRGPTLAVRGVGVDYGGRRVLGEVRCTIPGGRLTAIVGQSGGGKSTLIKVLSGQRRPDRGAVAATRPGPSAAAEADGAAYAGWAGRHVALVPQHDVVHEELTVQQCLGYAADLRLGPGVDAGTKRERVDRAVRDADLSGLAGRRVSDLSGGQRKRVNVAAELIGRPDVLLLDEPTTGLDHATEQNVVAGLRRLSRQGMTVAFVTHSLAAIDVADHVVVIAPAGAAGAAAIVEGTPADVKQRLGVDDRGRAARPAVADGPGAAGAADRRGPGPWRAVAARRPRAATLLARYARVWLSSPMASAAVLFGLPLALGVLIRLAVSADGWIGTDRLLFGVVAAFWIGMNQSVRELVRERLTFLHENGRHVGCLSFLLSKLAFLGAVAAPQAVLLSAPLKWLAVGPGGVTISIAELRCPWSLIVVTFWAAGVLGACVGLLLSAACMFLRRNGEVSAVLLVILVTLPQLLFSTKVIPEGLAKDPEHYHSFVLWHGEARVPEFCTYLTFSRYLSLPLDAASRESPALDKAIWFNGAILATAGVTTVVAAWLTLEAYVVVQRRRQ